MLLALLLGIGCLWMLFKLHFQISYFSQCIGSLMVSCVSVDGVWVEGEGENSHSLGHPLQKLFPVYVLNDLLIKGCVCSHTVPPGPEKLEAIVGKPRLGQSGAVLSGNRRTTDRQRGAHRLTHEFPRAPPSFSTHLGLLFCPHRP